MTQMDKLTKSNLLAEYEKSLRSIEKRKKTILKRYGKDFYSDIAKVSVNNRTRDENGRFTPKEQV